MERSDEWRKFEASFTTAARREDAKVGSGSDDLRIRAHGDYGTPAWTIGKLQFPEPGPLGGRWFLTEGSSESLKTQFELLATEAGAALDSPPPVGVAPLNGGCTIYSSI